MIDSKSIHLTIAELSLIYRPIAIVVAAEAVHRVLLP